MTFVEMKVLTGFERLCNKAPPLLVSGLVFASQGVCILSSFSSAYRIFLATKFKASVQYAAEVSSRVRFTLTAVAS